MPPAVVEINDPIFLQLIDAGYSVEDILARMRF